MSARARRGHSMDAKAGQCDDHPLTARRPRAAHAEGGTRGNGGGRLAAEARTQTGDPRRHSFSCGIVIDLDAALQPGRCRDARRPPASQCCEPETSSEVRIERAFVGMRFRRGQLLQIIAASESRTTSAT